MLAVVIPAQNEAGRIGNVIKKALHLKAQLILPVVNGCLDNTLKEILLFKSPLIYPVYFPEPLGIDVPRAVGAKYALDLGAKIVLFLDGDMIGKIEDNLEELVKAVKSGVDLALSNCYPNCNDVPPGVKKILEFRKQLNRRIGREEDLKTASPSHGPYATSRRLLLSVPLQELAVPPVMLVLSVKKELNVKVVTEIPHLKLNSRIKDTKHADAIAETLIGDCLEALSVWEGRPRSRKINGRLYIGYNSQRRRDILKMVIR